MRIMLRKDRYDRILSWFKENQPEPETELHYESPFQLLVAVILSAQCTDKRVNMVAPELFRRFPSPDDLAAASVAEVLAVIKSISYPNSKASHLVGMARKLIDEYAGVVPADIDSLMTLPGVGRKTANVLASIIYDKPVIAVDTHVFRVSHRMGLSDGKTVEKVEKELEEHIPEDLRAKAHHWLILHGRYRCTAKNPKCGECPLRDWCRDYEQKHRIII